MSSRLLFAVLSGLALGGCNNAVTVELVTGDQVFELSASAVELPTELRDSSTSPATILAIDCSGTGICPSSTELSVTCVSGLCDPGPHTVTVPVGDVVDFDELLADARSVLRYVDSIEIVEVQYSVSPNSLTIPLPDVLVYWGPEGAADITAPGVALLGTISGVGAMSALADEQMIVDPTGAALMSDYVIDVSRRIRFFAQTTIDLAPGGPFPDGSATVIASMRVRAIGRIIE